MDIRKELERLADGFAELSFPPLSALVFIEHPERQSLSDVAPIDWPPVKRMAMPSLATKRMPRLRTALLRRLSPGLHETFAKEDAVRSGLIGLMKRGGLLIGKAGVTGLPSRDQYPGKPCSEYWMHSVLAQMPDSVTCSCTHAKSDTAVTRMQVDHVAFVCQDFAGELARVLFDATWPVLRTKDAVRAMGVTSKTVHAWSKKHPERVQFLARGKFKVNPEWMTDAGRKKYCPESGVNRE